MGLELGELTATMGARTSNALFIQKEPSSVKVKSRRCCFKSRQCLFLLLLQQQHAVPERRQGEPHPALCRKSINFHLYFYLSSRPFHLVCSLHMFQNCRGRRKRIVCISWKLSSTKHWHPLASEKTYLLFCVLACAWCMVELAPQVKERVFIVPVELIETLDHYTNVLY